MKRTKTLWWVLSVTAGFLLAGWVVFESAIPDTAGYLARVQQKASQTYARQAEASSAPPPQKSAASAPVVGAPNSSTAAPFSAAQEKARAQAEAMKAAMNAQKQSVKRDDAQKQYVDMLRGKEQGSSAMSQLMASQDQASSGASAGPDSDFDGRPIPELRILVPPRKPITGLIAVGPHQKEIALPNFPWPPPAPSEKMDLPRTKFAAALGAKPMLSDVSFLLDGALMDADYTEFAYFRAPGGFALVARLEQIEADGTPVKGQRFLPPNGDSTGFSLASYVAQLFVAPEGFYRLIVFVVSDQPFVASAPAPSVSAAEAWLRQGADRLPPSYYSLPFTSAHRVSALVYEFRKSGKTDVSTLSPGRLDARTHLVKAGLYAALTGGR